MDSLEFTFTIIAVFGAILLALSYTDWGRKNILGYTDEEIKDIWHSNAE